MKIINITIVLCIIITIFYKEVKCNEENDTSIRPFQTRRSLVAKKLGIVWNWIKYKIGPTGNEFIARCAGGFKVLRIVLFAIVFKLGVILTTLGFLTIFSLKGLGLLVLLVLMNVTGFATKLAVAKHEGGWGGGHSHNRGGGTDIHLHVHAENKEKPPHYIEIPTASAPSLPYRAKYINSQSYGGWAAKNDEPHDASSLDTVDMFLGGRRPTEEDFQRYLRIRNLYDASTQ